MNKTDKKQADLNRQSLLLAAFGGSVDGWEYVETTDAGPGATQSLNPPKCPCGHPIRYICHWEHKDGRKTHTGNVCVNTVPHLSENALGSIAADVKELQRKEREAKAAAKKAAKAAEVDALRAECFELCDRVYRLTVEKVREMVGWLPADVYERKYRWSWCRRNIKNSSKLKTAAGQRKRLEAIKSGLERAVAV